MTKVTKDHCLEIINKFEPCSENQKQGVLGIDGKCGKFLVSNLFLEDFAELGLLIFLPNNVSHPLWTIYYATLNK